MSINITNPIRPYIYTAEGIRPISSFSSTMAPEQAIGESSVAPQPELSPFEEMKKKMVEFAEKVTAARSIKEADRQEEVNRLVQSFLDYAERGIRAPEELVDRVDREIVLYTELSEDDRAQYLNLSGYEYKNFKIVELEEVP